MRLVDLLNVAYVLLLDWLIDEVRSARQALMLASVFAPRGKQPELPDPVDVQRQLDVELSAPLPDPASNDLRHALGLST